MRRLTPIVEWIGDVPIRHGERRDSEACLCGHESYLTCPEWPDGGIAGLTLGLCADGSIIAWATP